MIWVDHLCLWHGPRTIFRDVSFEVPKGQTLALLGASGSGKTSLARLLLGVLPGRHVKTADQNGDGFRWSGARGGAGRRYAACSACRAAQTAANRPEPDRAGPVGRVKPASDRFFNMWQSCSRTATAGPHWLWHCASGSTFQSASCIDILRPLAVAKSSGF
ncbi:ATP-binding cassette domain-containing protein [Phaeobacter inhibens]|uniref:ATP-binding cassette domain-containing protein n=1 Tax=Phaeobacter inhibens TaxID=221822 RepID=UPI002882DE4E|nr:ATP-binding cassette domain-containing protein [Phaeobacter inhibens]